MTEKNDWPENKKYVLEKIDEHDSELDKQSTVNKTQSDWNHQTDRQLDRISERQSAIAAIFGAGAAFATGGIEKIVKFIADRLTN